MKGNIIEIITLLFITKRNKLIPPTRSGRWDFLSYNNPMAVVTICASSSSVKACRQNYPSGVLHRYHL